jgi:uncharacterized protein (TIGR02147 family)
MELPDVYGFVDFRAYLRAWFDAKKKRNPRFSHRAFARRAAQKSPSALLAVIDGKRNLTPPMAEAFVRAMGLDPEETEFFLALVRLQCADDPDLRDQALAQVRATRRFREARRLEGQSLEYLARWYYPAVRELAACAGFKADPEWIAGVLRPPITLAQATEALALLVDLGLLVPEEPGRLRPADVSLVTPHELAGLAARQYHLQMIECARGSLAYPPKDRHLCGVTVAVPAPMVAVLKRELDRFQERLLELCDGATDARQVVLQLNLQLVPLSMSLETIS